MSFPCPDSHCHLADPVFAADLEHVVARAAAAGVSAAVCILSADEPDEVSRATVVQAAWPAVRFATAIHPHHANAFQGRVPEAVRIVADAADRVGAVAIGEIGLDYHYDFAPRPVQQEILAAQAALAGARGVPVIIHTREAFDDTIAVLTAIAPPLRGVMHCFTGTTEEARRALDLGFYISIAGMVTFPKAASIRNLAAFVPEDRLLVETDAPFLAPVPHRGQRNEPAWVLHTLQAVAAVRGVAPEHVGARVRANLVELMGVPS